MTISQKIIIPEAEFQIMLQRFEILIKMYQKSNIEWITSEETCDMLNINQKALYFQSMTGKIGYSNFGNCRYYRKDEVLEFKIRKDKKLVINK